MPGGVFYGVPPVVSQLQQAGLLERAFHDGLFPNMLFRSEVEADKWPEHAGTEMLFTRPGLLTPVTKPLQPGRDPDPQVLSYEQWVARLYQYGASIDTHIPTSVTANADMFLRNIHALGLQAAQSLNRVVRNAYFQPYLSGQTNMIASAASGDVSIRVAALNGFTDVIYTTTTVRPVTVSPTSPLQITIKNSTGDIVRQVVGYAADNANDPLGPGTLFLNTTLGAAVADRTPVLSVARPLIQRAGGGFSIDAIGVNDVLQVQDFINAASTLRQNNIMPHEDGFYHAHIVPLGQAQIFTDPVMQRLNTGLVDGSYYQQAFIGSMANVAFMVDSETPTSQNVGALTPTSGSAFYAEDIGAEVINAAGIPIGRCLITGRGALQERWLDEASYVTEAGVAGKIGEFSVNNQGIAIETLRTRLLLRAPINRLMDKVAATWTTTTSFAAPSDITAGGPQRFKRAMVLEFALPILS